MAASSVSSDIAAVFALVIICILVLLLLRQYLPLRQTPAFLLIPVFLALALPSSIVLLVPIDLASSSGTDTQGTRGLWLPESVMVVAWRVAYWLIFSLTWLILPLLGDYMDSGYRDANDRVKYSLRCNARYQLIVLGTGAAGAVYFFVQLGFGATSLKALVMDLAYSWGLVLAIYLMGHGLVALPRSLMRDASVSGRLKRLQTRAPRIHEKLEEALEELDEVELQIVNLKSRKTGMKKDIQDWVDELYDTSALADSSAAPLRAGASVPAVVTERFMSEVARKAKRARHKKARFVAEWDNLVHQASRLQYVLDSASSRRLEFPPSHGSRVLTPYMRYHLYTHIIPSARMGLGIFLAILSVLLIWSEFVHNLEPKLSVVGLSVVHHPSSSRGQIGLAGQLIAALWLLYMCASALYSVSEFKGWGNRALVRRGTYPESACWYSMQVAKLTVPLSYNFITMVPNVIHEGTVFYHFLGRLIDHTQLGSGFSNYFPMFVLIPVFATLFNLYGKVRSVIGFGVLDDDSDDNRTGFSLGGWREGRALIERELQSGGGAGGSSDQLNLSTASERLLSGTSSPAVRGSIDNNNNNNSSGGGTTRPSRLAIDRARATAARRAIPPPSSRRVDDEQEDNGDRYFFQDFTERVKNTLDSADRPAWLRGIGDGFQRPRWMGNDDDDDGGNRRGGGGGGGGENIFSRWFGNNNAATSSSSNGNIRL